MASNSSASHTAHFGEIAFAGSLAGTSSDAICHAIDTVKTRMQTPNASYTSTVHAFSSILRHEGIGGFYGGLSATVTSASLCSVLYFWSYERSKALLADRTQLPPSVTYFLGGCIGEIATSIVFVPLEVVKTRMQVQGATHIKVRSVQHRPYVSLADAISNISKYEGFWGFYRGYTATLFREIPYAAIFFTVYEEVKSRVFLKGTATHVQRHKSSKNDYVDDSNDQDQYLHPIEGFITGALSGAVAGAITTPFDVVKTRSQLKSGTHRGLWKVAVKIVSREGWLVLFAGLPARVLYQTPQAAMMIFVYEWASSFGNVIFNS
eukprot:CFRG3903T1